MTDTKPFPEEILERLAKAVKNLLHPSLYEYTLREVGTGLGREVAAAVRQGRATPGPFTRDDYLRCSEWMKTHWGWNQAMRMESEHQFCVQIQACPFEALSAEDDSICQIEAAILGSIAGDQFGYGKVTVQRASDTPPKHCRMTVHLERTPQSLTAEGLTFQTNRNGEKHAALAGPDKRALAKLTQRERQIVRLLAEGLSDKQIAGALRLSVRTVEGHLARIREKTALHSRSALIRFALRSSAP